MNTATLLRDENASFQIRKIEELEPRSAIYDDRYRKQSNFEIVWITDGNGEIEMDMLRYPLSPGSFLIIPPGHVRRMMASTMLDGFYLSLSPDFLCRVRGRDETPFFDPVSAHQKAPHFMHLETGISAEMENLIMIIMLEFDKENNLRPDLLCAYTGVLLLYVSMLFDSGPRMDFLGREKEIVARFSDLVKRHFAQKKMVSDYASELFISPNYLNQVVKKITGYTASYHIQQRVIFEAKRRAVTPGFKLKEIAYSLGFDDCGHFSKFFKRKCGMTYTRFRREAGQSISYGHTVQAVPAAGGL
jgi:AraC family transcriptional activator of pobA